MGRVYRHGKEVLLKLVMFWVGESPELEYLQRRKEDG
jgi:hypothetical protein